MIPDLDIYRVANCSEGSVRRLAGRVRITAQLIDTTTGEHLWADRFDCMLEELFDVQDELAHAGALKVRLDRQSLLHQKTSLTVTAHPILSGGAAASSANLPMSSCDFGVAAS